jgi:hypothetical protein
MKIPKHIIYKIQSAAPSYSYDNESLRRVEDFSVSDEERHGYKNIIIYVQNGLGDKIDLFKEIVYGIFKIQANSSRRYNIFTFGFGKTQSLQHENKLIKDLGYPFETINYNKIAEIISRISGLERINPAIINELFPQTGVTSLYHGKTKIENHDLLIIIGNKNEVFLGDNLKDKIKSDLMKRMLFVEIDNNEVTYKTNKEIEFNYKSLINLNNNKNMANNQSTFKRELSQKVIDKLNSELLFKQHLLPDIRKGDVFPAIRGNDRIDFYHKGGKLFQFDNNGFTTHIKYAAVINSQNKNYYLSENDLKNFNLTFDFHKNYDRIKENCSKYSGNEAEGVSRVYSKYSYILQKKDIVILDLEISLNSKEDNIVQDEIDLLLLNKKNKTQDRIDLLLYNINERKLKFVEAKHYSNKEIWSKTEAKVISQIRRYENQIGIKKVEIIIEYNKYIRIVNDLFKINIPTVNDIEEKVTLLIFDFDNDQKQGRLKTLVKDKKEYNNITIYTKGNIKDIEIKTLWNTK